MLKKIFSILFVFLFLFSFVGQVRAGDMQKEAFCDPRNREKEQSSQENFKVCCREESEININIGYPVNSFTNLKCGSSISLPKTTTSELLKTGWLFHPTGCDPGYEFVNDTQLLPRMCLLRTMTTSDKCPDGTTKHNDCCIHLLGKDPGDNAQNVTCNAMMLLDPNISCEKAALTTRVDGASCVASYIDSCGSDKNSVYYIKSGNTCTINESVLPAGSSSYFKGTDFKGKCPEGNVDTAIGCIPTDSIDETLGFFLRWIFIAAGGIIVLTVIRIGFNILTSNGNPDKLKSAKEHTIALVSGILLIIFSLTLLRVIGADILGLPGFITP